MTSTRSPAPVLLILSLLFGIGGGYVGGTIAGSAPGSRSRSPHQPAPIDVPTPASGDIGRQLDSFQARLTAIEEQLRAAPISRERTPVRQEGADLGRVPADQLAERLREPVLKIVEEAQHERAWRKQCDDLYGNACALTHMGQSDYLGDDTRKELTAFLMQEFKPFWELRERIQAMPKGTTYTPEDLGALRDSERAYYQALSNHYAGELADRAYLLTTTGWGGTEDATVLHKTVMDSLK